MPGPPPEGLPAVGSQWPPWRQHWWPKLRPGGQDAHLESATHGGWPGPRKEPQVPAALVTVQIVMAITYTGVKHGRCTNANNPQEPEWVSTDWTRRGLLRWTQGGPEPEGPTARIWAAEAGPAPTCLCRPLTTEVAAPVAIRLQLVVVGRTHGQLVAQHLQLLAATGVRAALKEAEHQQACGALILGAGAIADLRGESCGNMAPGRAAGPAMASLARGLDSLPVGRGQSAGPCTDAEKLQSYRR